MTTTRTANRHDQLHQWQKKLEKLLNDKTFNDLQVCQDCNVINAFPTQIEPSDGLRFDGDQGLTREIIGLRSLLDRIRGNIKELEEHFGKKGGNGVNKRIDSKLFLLQVLFAYCAHLGGSGPDTVTTLAERKVLLARGPYRFTCFDDDIHFLQFHNFVGWKDHTQLVEEFRGLPAGTVRTLDVVNNFVFVPHGNRIIYLSARKVRVHKKMKSDNPLSFKLTAVRDTDKDRYPVPLAIKNLDDNARHIETVQHIFDKYHKRKQYAGLMLDVALTLATCWTALGAVRGAAGLSARLGLGLLFLHSADKAVLSTTRLVTSRDEGVDPLLLVLKTIGQSINPKDGQERAEQIAKVIDLVVQVQGAYKSTGWLAGQLRSGSPSAPSRVYRGNTHADKPPEVDARGNPVADRLDFGVNLVNLKSVIRKNDEMSGGRATAIETAHVPSSDYNNLFYVVNEASAGPINANSVYTIDNLPDMVIQAIYDMTTTGPTVALFQNAIADAGKLPAIRAMEEKCGGETNIARRWEFAANRTWEFSTFLSTAKACSVTLRAPETKDFRTRLMPRGGSVSPIARFDLPAGTLIVMTTKVALHYHITPDLNATTPGGGAEALKEFLKTQTTARRGRMEDMEQDEDRRVAERAEGHQTVCYVHAQVFYENDLKDPLRINLNSWGRNSSLKARSSVQKT